MSARRLTSGFKGGNAGVPDYEDYLQWPCAILLTRVNPSPASTLCPMPSTAGRLCSTREGGAQHDRISTTGDGLDHVATAAHTPVGDDVYVTATGLIKVVASCGCDVGNRRSIWRMYTKRLSG